MYKRHKLKYACLQVEDLLEIYQLFIRSCAEYCSVAFHSGLTLSESASLERLQSTCLKVILQDNYISYSAALEMTGLQTLHERREERCLNFSIKCIKHSRNSRFFHLKSNYCQFKIIHLHLTATFVTRILEEFSYHMLY